jgi:hypothetical protein
MAERVMIGDFHLRRWALAGGRAETERPAGGWADRRTRPGCVMAVVVVVIIHIYNRTRFYRPGKPES